MTAELYSTEFQKHKSKAMAAHRAGEVRDARYHLLKAAEFLYKLAGLSKGRLRDTRIENARRLVELAKRMTERPNRKKKRAAETGGGTAEEEARPSEWRVTEKPVVRFADIAGLEEVKEQIRIKMIYPFSHPDKARRYGVTRGGGILLYGPPGTGKTMLGKAVSAELDSPFYLIKPSDILSKWVGESEKNIAGLFAEARGHERAVIFIDEVEALVPARREMQSNVMQRVVPQVLAELDGFEKKGGSLLFLGATNEPWEIDAAMLRPGRLDEKIYVGLPDEAARRAILQAHLRGAPLARGVDLEALAKRLDGYSGADLAYICRKARETVFRESVERGTDREIASSDLERIVSSMGPSVERKVVERFEAFRRELSR